MIVVFLFYWAFLAWLFNDNFIINYIESLTSSAYYFTCNFINEDSVCVLIHIVPNFQSAMAFIVSLFLISGYGD